FLLSDNDTTDSDTLDTPPSPTHDTPFAKITASTKRSPVIPRRRVMILAPGQPIPHGRPVTHPAMSKDIPEPAQEGAVEVTYETLEDLIQREQGRKIVGVESAVTALTERVAELEKDNQWLRGTASVESQRVDRLQRGMSPEEIEAREVARNLEVLNENEEEQEGENEGNENGGNEGNGNGDNEGNGNVGNGNEGNGNHGMNYGG
nr:hypothetical protein [Tanacetum cinerariifolium]